MIASFTPRYSERMSFSHGVRQSCWQYVYIVQVCPGESGGEHWWAALEYPG